MVEHTAVAAGNSCRVCGSGGVGTKSNSCWSSLGLESLLPIKQLGFWIGGQIDY